MDVDRHKTFYVHFNDHNIELIATHYLKNPLLMSPCDMSELQQRLFEDIGGRLLILDP